jgi:predicted transport protein
MEGIVSFGNKRSYDDFKKQIPSTIQPLFDLVREFCLSLGENVVEDIRMHRVVFGKSMAFRWFVDIEPERENIIIKIQKSRKEDPRILQIKIGQEITELKEIIRDAFKTIN